MEEDQIEQDPSIVNFIPCIHFVKRGVAKEQPDKVALTREDLIRVIEETRQELGNNPANRNDDGDDDSSDINENHMETNDDTEPQNPNDEFNFENYDQEDDSRVVAISDIAVFEPDEHISDGEDSEAEDDLIKPTDNLLLVGHVDDDASSLEVYVYNEEENSFYVHHDFLLPSFPLCIEWMNYDPESKDPGNMCAIGCIEPIITIWDLDIQDSLEPALKLGAKANRKKGIVQSGHNDAVLDMSWNTHFQHILASGSVDRTVILWDLDEQQPHTTIRSFQEKVQSLKFHPTEAQQLLTGSCDGTVRLFDCRDPNAIDTSFKQWSFPSTEVERVYWDSHSANHYFVGLNNGTVHYCDIRQEGSSLWHLEAHSDEVSGILVNQQKAGVVTTTSADGTLKIWRYNASTAPTLIYEHEVGIGRIQCAHISPDNGFSLAVGGDNKQKQLRVIDIRDFEVVRKTLTSMG